MKLTSKELKRLARQTLINRYGTPVGAYIMIQVILNALILPFILFFQESLLSKIVYLLASFIISIINGLFICGLIKLLLAMIRKQPYQINDIFYCFKNHPDRYIIVTFIISIPSFIFQIPSSFLDTSSESLENLFVNWGISAGFNLLQVIALTIISLFFGLSGILLIEHQEMTPSEVLKESLRLLKGNKGRMFSLMFSFLGMFILGILSISIGFLWVLPYYYTTLCFFYLNLTNQLPSYDVTI